MKTFKEIKTLSYNDYAFFKGISINDAKWEFACKMYKNISELPLTKTGVPIISLKEKIDKKEFDFKMKSNSILEGEDQMKYLCDFYNKGIPLQKLKQYSESEPMRKALRFTGSNQIINDILEPSQLLKIQKTWLLRNVYLKRKYSDKTIHFIHKNDWAINFLTENGVDKDLVSDQLNAYVSLIDSKKTKK